MSPHPTPSASCPFCNIAASYPPIPPSTFLPTSSDPNSEAESTARPEATSLRPLSDAPGAQTHLVLSTTHVLAFLDIMPLTRGHVLLVTRAHWKKLGEVGVGVGGEIGKWLPIVSRVVMKTVLGKHVRDSDVHWNVVQNNGARAAQLVPHVHFHIIPRPSTDAVPSDTKTSWVMFGRGQREELDDDEGEELARDMRKELAREVRRIKEVEGIDLNVDAEAWDKGRELGKL